MRNNGNISRKNVTVGKKAFFYDFGYSHFLVDGYDESLIYIRHTSSCRRVGCMTRPILGPRPKGPAQALFNNA